MNRLQPALLAIALFYDSVEPLNFDVFFLFRCAVWKRFLHFPSFHPFTSSSSSIIVAYAVMLQHRALVVFRFKMHATFICWVYRTHSLFRVLWGNETKDKQSVDTDTNHFYAEQLKYGYENCVIFSLFRFSSLMFNF